jgi:hypothetical protein
MTRLCDGVVEGRGPTMEISERSAARCDSKYDLSGKTVPEDEAAGLFVEDDILKDSCGLWTFR